MKKSIEQCMSGFEVKGGGELSAAFIFPDGFIGFQGHFPENKILPGICQIQCAVSMLEKWQGKRAVLKEIVSAKFFSPVLPAEELICKAGSTEDGNGAVVLKASFSKDGKKVSEMKLRVQFKPNDGGVGN